MQIENYGYWLLFTSPLNPLSKYGEGTSGPRFSPSPRVGCGKSAEYPQ
jgi:hypothetical protein